MMIVQGDNRIFHTKKLYKNVYSDPSIPLCLVPLLANRLLFTTCGVPNPFSRSLPPPPLHPSMMSSGKEIIIRDKMAEEPLIRDDSVTLKREFDDHLQYNKEIIRPDLMFMCAWVFTTYFYRRKVESFEFVEFYSISHCHPLLSILVVYNKIVNKQSS